MQATTLVLLLERERSDLAQLLRETRSPVYAVTTCSDAAEASRLLHTRRFDLFLLGDHHNDTSRELLKATCTPELRHMPVVVLVEGAGQPAVMALLQAGAADVLYKPLRRNEVATLWQHVWRRRASCAPARLLDVPGEEAASLTAPLTSTPASQPACGPPKQQQQQQTSGSLHSDESHPASDNSSSSALRLDLASRLQLPTVTGSYQQPAPQPTPSGGSQGLFAALHSEASSGCHLSPPRGSTPQGASAAPCQSAPTQGEEQGAARAQPASPCEEAAEARAQQQGRERAFADSLAAFRLAVSKLPATPAVQLGIAPLRVSPLGAAPPGGPASSSAETSLMRLASLTSAASLGLGQQQQQRQQVALPQGRPIGSHAPGRGYSGYTNPRLGGASSAPGPAKAPAAAPQAAPAPSLKRAASALLQAQLPAPKRASTHRTRHAAAALPEEADGPAQWRAHRQAALIRWKEKRAARKFTKTVRYESRRRLAAARPRVRGQFVKAVKVEA